MKRRVVTVVLTALAAGILIAGILIAGKMLCKFFITDRVMDKDGMENPFRNDSEDDEDTDNELLSE